MSYKLTQSDVTMLRKMAERFRRDNPKPKGKDYKYPRGAGGYDVSLGIAAADIIPPTSTGTANLYDGTVTPPADKTKVVEGLHLDWLVTDGAKISEGRMIAWRKVNGVDRILWAQCEPPTLDIYTADPVAVITPGTTIDMPWTIYGDSPNQALTLIGGTTFEAKEDVLLGYATDLSTEYIATNNNQDLTLTVDLAIVAGTPEIIPVPLIDSFTSPRAGTFPKTHSQPSGLVSFSAGDQVKMTATNQAGSTMDFDIVTGLITWRAP